MVKLVERALVKDLANIARADTQFDARLNSMIAQASTQVEKMTKREYEKKVRVDFLQSYEQYWNEPEPEYLWVTGYPIDTDESLEIIWASQDRHDTNGVTLSADATPPDYLVQSDIGLITARGATGLISNFPPYSSGQPLFTYDPRGFRVTYTGGYVLSTTPTAGVAALGSITFASNPSNNDTVTLGGSVWTFKTAATLALETTIGATLVDTLFALIADLNASIDAAVTLCTYSVSSGTVIGVVSDIPGTGGNSFTLAASVATPSGATLAGGTDEPSDPLDDYGVVQVPDDLKMIVARKVAADWKDNKMLKAWTEDEKSLLKEYTRKLTYVG